MGGVLNLLNFLGVCEEECVSCGKRSHFERQGYVCEECINSIKPYTPVEYTKLDYITSYRVFGRYEGVLEATIRVIKFHKNVPLAHKLGEVLSPYLWEYVREIEPDLITFPAINLRRFWSRGFNHVEEMLKGARVDYVEVFKRIGFDPPSTKLKKEDRLRAVKSHLLKEELIDFLEDKRVLVVDDVLTTGATITRLGELLLSVGALEVHAFFVAKEF